MKKLSEKESKGVGPTPEELELEQVLREIQLQKQNQIQNEKDEEGLPDQEETDLVTQRLYAQIAAYEAAKQDMDSRELTQAILEDPSIEEKLNRYPDMTAEDRKIFLAGLQATKASQENIVDLVDSSTGNVLELEVREGQDDSKEIKFKKRSKKYYLLLVAVLVTVLALGTVGVGEDFKWLEVGQTEVGDDIAVTVESDADIIVVEDMEEKDAYAYAEEVLGVPVIQLPKKGEGLDFESIELYVGGSGGILLYDYDGKTIYYNVIQNTNAMSYNEVMIGTLIESYEVEAVGGTVLVEKYMESDRTEIIKATFKCNNVYYSIKGSIDEADLKEILKNIIFF